MCFRMGMGIAASLVYVVNARVHGVKWFHLVFSSSRVPLQCICSLFRIWQVNIPRL